MSSSLTTSDLAQDALLGMLTEDADLHELATQGRLTLGEAPGGAHDEQVWIAGDVSDWTAEDGALDSSTIEDYTLSVIVQVRRAEATWEPIRDRLLELGRLVAAVHESDRSLVGTVRWSYLAGGTIEEIAEETRRGRLTILVRCRGIPA